MCAQKKIKKKCEIRKKYGTGSMTNTLGLDIKRMIIWIWTRGPDDKQWQLVHKHHHQCVRVYQYYIPPSRVENKRKNMYQITTNKINRF